MSYMLHETTVSATFVYVSVDSNRAETNFSQIRDVLFAQIDTFGGSQIANTGGLLVAFKDQNDRASDWLRAVANELERDLEVFAIGVDRGIAVAGVDFLTGSPFLKSDAIDRARELARTAGKGRVAVGIDAIAEEESWSGLFDLKFDTSGGYRCKAGPLSQTAQIAGVAIPEHGLIARDGLLATMWDIFNDEPFVWLHGPTGVGKTAVASHFATWWRGTLQRDLAWIDAKRFKTLEDVVFEFARQIGVQLTHIDDLQVILRSLKHQRDWLVVVDQADLIADDLNALLEASDVGTLRVLVTVRNSPSTEAASFEVPPLSDDAIIAIIADRLTRPVMPNDMPTLAKACSGRPALARWAAEQCAHHSVQHVVQELTNESPSATVTGVFENTFSFSWIRLTAVQRDVIEFLSVFEGGAPVDAIQQTFSAFNLNSDLDAPDFRTFVQYDRNDQNPRLQLFPFAARFVELNVGAEPRYREIHADYFISLADKFNHLINTQDEIRTISRLKVDLANFRKAMETVWSHPQRLAPIVVVFEKALRIVGSIPGLDEITTKLKADYGDLPSLSIPIDLVNARQSIALGNFEIARTILDELQLLISPEDRYASEYQITLSNFFRQQGDVEFSIASIRRAMETAQTDVDHWRADSMYSAVLFETGEVTHASRILRDIVVECEIPSTRARACKVLGTLLANQDNPEEAQTYAGFVHRYCADVESNKDRITIDLAMARSLFRTGQTEDAFELFDATLDRALRLGGSRRETLAMAELAFYRVINGDLIDGLAHADRVLSKTRRTPVRFKMEVARTIALSKMTALDQSEQALAAAINELVPTTLEQDSLLSVARIYVDLGRAFRAQEAGENALTFVGKARSQTRMILEHSPSTELTFLVEQAITALDDFENPDNRFVLEVARDGRWFKRYGESRVDITRRTALKRLVLGLMERHEISPGESISLDDAFEIGWPGEKAMEQSKVRRVYSTVNRLRSLGFQEIVTSDGGYLIDPSCNVKFVDETVN